MRKPMYNSDIAVIPHLRSTLLNTTALTPTHHGFFKKLKNLFKKIAPVIAIAASAYLPQASAWAASTIAASAGVSLAANSLAAAVSAGAIGAIGGATLAKISGGDPWMGAAGGFALGGIGGYNASAGLGANSGLGYGDNVAPGSYSVTSAPNIAATASAGSPIVTTAAQPAVPVGPDLSSAYEAVPVYEGFTNAPTSFIPGAANGPAGQYGTTLTSNATPGVNTAGMNGPAGQYGEVIPAYKYTPTSALPASAMNSRTAGGVNVAGVTPTSGIAPQNFKTTASNFLQDAGKWTGSKVTDFMGSDEARAAAGKLMVDAAGEASVGNQPAMSDEEQQYRSQLAAARAQEQELINKRIDVSNSYMQQAANASPEREGRYALTDYYNAQSREDDAALRRINPRASGLRDTTIRQQGLNTSRGLSAYSQGVERGRDTRRKYTDAALGALPDGAGVSSGYATDLAAADKRYSRLTDAQQSASNVYQPIADYALGTMSKEERDKLDEKTKGT